MAEAWRGIRVTIPSEVRFLGPIRIMIDEACGISGLTEEDRAEVQIAVQEGCANVIRHCYKSEAGKRIDLRVSFFKEALEIRVDDYGTFVDPAQIRGRELEDVRPGGLGVHLMRKSMDEVRYAKNAWGGTTLTLVKRLGKEGGAKENA